MTINAYPLCWPPTIPRSKQRERGAFKTSLAGALILAEIERIDRMGGSDAE